MNKGFTLAEMLIALLLTAMAVAIVSEGVRRSINYQGQLNTIRLERETQAAALDAIRGRIARLLPVTVPAGTEEEPEILFAGTASRLVFLAADPGYPSRAGVYEYRLELTGSTESDDASTSSLTVWRRPLTNLETFDRDAEAGDSWTIALSQPLSFGYLGSGANSAPDWSNQAEFPSMIMLMEEGSVMPIASIAVPRMAPERESDSPPPAPETEMVE